MVDRERDREKDMERDEREGERERGREIKNTLCFLMGPFCQRGLYWWTIIYRPVTSPPGMASPLDLEDQTGCGRLYL